MELDDDADVYDEDETGPMVDDYHFVNGADRSFDGKFAQWEKRIFDCDGRTKLNGERIVTVARIVRDAAEEIPTAPRRFALRGVADLRRFVDYLELEVIAEARAEGWSWRDIAAATGLSHSALHKRFAQYEVRSRSGAAPERCHCPLLWSCS